jgi:hypothetical protein
MTFSMKIGKEMYHVRVFPTLDRTLRTTEPILTITGCAGNNMAADQMAGVYCRMQAVLPPTILENIAVHYYYRQTRVSPEQIQKGMRSESYGLMIVIYYGPTRQIERIQAILAGTQLHGCSMVRYGAYMLRYFRQKPKDIPLSCQTTIPPNGVSVIIDNLVVPSLKELVEGMARHLKSVVDMSDGSAEQQSIADDAMTAPRTPAGDRHIMSVHRYHDVVSYNSIDDTPKEARQAVVVMYNGGELTLQEQLMLQEYLLEEYKQRARVNVITRKKNSVVEMTGKTPAWSSVVTSTPIANREFSPAVRTSLHNVTDIEKQIGLLSTKFQQHIDETKKQNAELTSKVAELSTELQDHKKVYTSDLEKIMSRQDDNFAKMMARMDANKSGSPAGATAEG